MSKNNKEHVIPQQKRENVGLEKKEVCNKRKRKRKSSRVNYKEKQSKHTHAKGTYRQIHTHKQK